MNKMNLNNIHKIETNSLYHTKIDYLYGPLVSLPSDMVMVMVMVVQRYVQRCVQRCVQRYVQRIFYQN